MKIRSKAARVLLALTLATGLGAGTAVSASVATATPAQADAIYWYNAPNNNPWICFTRGENSRRILVKFSAGYRHQWQCAKVSISTPGWKWRI